MTHILKKASSLEWKSPHLKRHNHYKDCFDYFVFRHFEKPFEHENARKVFQSVFILQKRCAIHHVSLKILWLTLVHLLDYG